MPATLIAQIIATGAPYAIQLVTLLIEKWNNNSPITQAEWASVISASTLSAADHIKAVAARAGISPDDATLATLLKYAAQ